MRRDKKGENRKERIKISKRERVIRGEGGESREKMRKGRENKKEGNGN